VQNDVIRTQIISTTKSTEQSRPVNRIQAFFKRTFDIIFSFLGLFFLLPVFAIIGLAIKRESPGPVFYRGLRMGKDQKPFKINKFRTMYRQTAGDNGPSITAFGDPRITKMGHYLRDTKLNELPQLWNVFIGDMSLVGPRPEDYQIALTWPEDFKKEIFSVRPGITSPASIVYRDEEKMLKGESFMDEYLRRILPDKQRLDHLYIQNLSFFTDVDILAATLVVLLPQIRGKKMDESILFGGPTLTLFRKIVPWFLIDIVVATISVGISGIVWRLSAVINLGIPIFITLALAIAVFISLINMLLGLQKVSWREASPAYVVDIGISVGLTMLVLWLINRFWLTDPWIPFSLFWLITITTYVGLVGVRYRERLVSSLAYRWLLFRGSEASFAERILIVGAGQLGELTSWLIQRSTYSTLFGVVGYVDDDPKKRNMRIGQVKVLGPTVSIPELVEKYSIGIIIFAISNADQTSRDKIKSICDSTDAKIIVMPDLIKKLEDAFEGFKPNGNGKRR
jgi:lipopolysaccharide/colanic/teichoic acid biosynthesis glycosyltransferase